MHDYLGIEIGGTKLQIARGDDAGRVAERTRLAVEKAKGAAGIRHQLERALTELVRDHKPEAVGVGFGGPVDWKAGKICRSHHIEGWSEFELGEWLQDLTGAPAIIDNDANVAALGEATHGAGVGFNPVFYVTLGSGVGGGLVVDGRIYHGAMPGEAELGHVRLARSGTTLESRCSGWAVDAKIRALKTNEPSSLLARLIGDSGGGEAKHLPIALQQGDAAAASILNEVAEDLAFGLSHVVHLFHPEIIVLGGGLANVGEPLRTGVEAALTGFIMEAFRPGPEIVMSKLGEDAVTVGALVLAR